MSLNTLVDTLINLIEGNLSDWVLFIISVVATILFAVFSGLAKKMWDKFNQPRTEKVFILQKFHGHVTDFTNLYNSYQQDSYPYMDNRLEDKMETISHNITHLVSRSELKIDASILRQLNKIANDYNAFAHRIISMGETGDDELAKMYQETLKIKELLENKI